MNLPRFFGGALVMLLAPACHKQDEGAEEKQPPVEVQCVLVRTASIDETVHLRGRLAPPPGGDLAVAAQIPGRVLETKVHEGDHLAKGAIVAIVDDLEPRAAAKQADAALARAKSADVNAQAVLARTHALAAQGLASKADVEDAVAKADAARAEIEANQAALRLASGNLGRVDVRSTFDGVVTKVWRGAGAIVDGTAATPIIELASTSAVEFAADVTEREIALLQEGQKAEVFLATGLRLHGMVLSRSRALDPATGLGVVRVQIDGLTKNEQDDQRHDAKPSPDPEPYALAPLGSFGSVVIAIGRRDGVLAIPPAALRGAIADGAEIAVCNGDKAELRKVTVGYRDATQAEITGGLKNGEKVAVGHILGLEDGTRIVESKDDKGDKDDSDEARRTDGPDHP